MHWQPTAQKNTLYRASEELEVLRRCPGATTASPGIPDNCRTLLRQIAGNTLCVDCGAANPTWANVSYGSLICLVCSGKHRSYGVRNSVVRSIDMDSWTHSQVLAMLEGGNSQLEGFFGRHEMGNKSSLTDKRYHTKAARFYKLNLQRHSEQLRAGGSYKGREASRQVAKREASNSSTDDQNQCANEQRIDQRQTLVAA